MCPVSHAQSETRSRAPVFPVLELYLPQLKFRAAPCSRTLCNLSAARNKSGIRGIAHIRLALDFLLRITPERINSAYKLFSSHPFIMHRTTGLVYLILPLLVPLE